MSPEKPVKNFTPHLPEDFDARISSVLPYYSCFHQETINFIKSLPSSPRIWLDTGCGTGSLVNKAVRQFPATKFLLLDPSEGMLSQARKKLSSCLADRLEFLEASATQEFSQELKEQPDVITAIQCHHYLTREDRAKATGVCYNLLKEGGVYIRTEEEIEEHLKRFDTEYFPITIEEHLKLLRETGFRTVELFWYSYMQAGFYCIK
jgi:tRNA (cmo5U34)-methyltransferase